MILPGVVPNPKQINSRFCVTTFFVTNMRLKICTGIRLLGHFHGITARA